MQLAYPERYNRPSEPKVAGLENTSSDQENRCLMVGFTEVQTTTFDDPSNGLQRDLVSVKSVDEALYAIENKEFDYVFISIEGVDEFAPLVAKRIRQLVGDAAGFSIIAVGNYIHENLQKLLIESGFNKILLRPSFYKP